MGALWTTVATTITITAFRDIAAVIREHDSKVA